MPCTNFHDSFSHGTDMNSYISFGGSMSCPTWNLHSELDSYYTVFKFQKCDARYTQNPGLYSSCFDNVLIMFLLS